MPKIFRTKRLDKMGHIGNWMIAFSLFLFVLAGILYVSSNRLCAAPNDSTTKTVSTFIMELRDILDDKDADGYSWGDDEFIRWINAGRREIATFGSCFQRWDDIPLVSGQTTYDMPDDMITIIWAFYIDSSSSWIGLKRANPFTFGNAVEELRTVQDPLFFIELPGQVAILPAVTTVTTESMKVLTSYMPMDLASSSSALAMPITAVDALKHYVLHYALIKDKQNARASLYQKMFNDELGALRKIFVGQPLGNEGAVPQ